MENQHPVPFPFDLMRDKPFEYADWQKEVGEEEAGRQITDAARAHMKTYGVRAILDLGEIMEDATAVLAEFSTVDLSDLEGEDSDGL